MKPLLKGRSVEATFRVKSSNTDGNESDTNSHSALLLCDDKHLTSSSSKSNYELHELKDVNRLLTTRHKNQIWLRRCVNAWFRAIDSDPEFPLLETPKPHKSYKKILIQKIIKTKKNTVKYYSNWNINFIVWLYINYKFKKNLMDR